MVENQNFRKSISESLPYWVSTKPVTILCIHGKVCLWHCLRIYNQLMWLKIKVACISYKRSCMLNCNKIWLTVYDINERDNLGPQTSLWITTSYNTHREINGKSSSSLSIYIVCKIIQGQAVHSVIPCLKKPNRKKLVQYIS